LVFPNFRLDFRDLCLDFQDFRSDFLDILMRKDFLGIHIYVREEKQALDFTQILISFTYK
jgi:hypothetical protein